jgi:hypothetical protein
MRKATLAILAVFWSAGTPSDAFSWGSKGHQIVGAVADIIIQRDYPEAAERIRQMLGKSLSEVAVWADCAKGACPMPKPVRDYVARNPHHSLFHYTDVPIQRDRYVANTAGTSPSDVVQVLRYAVKILSGQEQKSGPANLTESEAIWVIAHLVGDIHQPLHVGAIYFDRSCANVVDPNETGANEENFGIKTTVADSFGGNRLLLPPDRQVHGLWDNDAVDGAMALAGDAGRSVPQFAQWLVENLSVSWQTPGNPSVWSYKWADEILPLAREAHQRLVINPGIDQHNSHELVCLWPTSLKEKYDEWAAGKAKEQLTKAGFRLAAILHSALEGN